MVSYQFEELNKIRKNAGVLILIVVDNGLALPFKEFKKLAEES